MARRKRDVARPDGVHVMAAQCASCILHPDLAQRFPLEPGRLAQMVRDCQQRDTAVTCHETLSGVGAICRGIYELRERGRGIQILQLAQRMGVVIFDGVPNESTRARR